MSELLESERRKKTPTSGGAKNTKDKRVPTVKKELNTQKEILLADNETRLQSPGWSAHAEASHVLAKNDVSVAKYIQLFWLL